MVTDDYRGRLIEFLLIKISVIFWELCEAEKISLCGTEND